jgi:uncharacterized protein (TIGR00159 family)
MFDNLLTNIRLSDAADIGILSLLIYRLLLLMKGTRALQMAWGLLILIPMYMLAKYLDLYTLIWILDRFSGYLVLAIIILFQDDIRRALARVGNPFFPSLGRQAESQVMEELLRAVFALAAGNVGALIALEREGSLDDYIEVGVRVDAQVSHELIQAVFQINSPIHDGAVIVQKDRIAAAGCFLPLTTNLEVSKALGTRHRAALGLTDETDAVVLVVSEEEGRVSLVQGGKIRVMPDINALRQALQKIYSIQQPRTLLRFGRPA